MVEATFISLVEWKRSGGKSRPLNLVFTSSSLGTYLVASSGHCFGDCSVKIPVLEVLVRPVLTRHQRLAATQRRA